MSQIPRLILKNQFGEESFNNVLSDVTDVYEAEGHSYQLLPIDMNVGEDVGSTALDPKFIAPLMGNIFGEDLTKAGAYLAGLIGAYSILGTKASHWPTGGVVGVVSDGVTDVDGAVVAHLDGDSETTVVNAAFKAMMKNSNVGSGFNYGLDLTEATVDGFPALAILKAALRLDNNVCVKTGNGAPVDGTTGLNYAGPGSLYVDYTNSVVYLQTGLISSPVWVPFSQGLAAPSLTFDHSVGAKTITVRQTGKVVTVGIPAGAISDGLGTVCATTSGLALAYRPAAAVTFPALVIDNGTTRKIGQVVISTAGVITFSVLGTGFTNAQAAGWDAVAVSYPVA